MKLPAMFELLVVIINRGQGAAVTAYLSSLGANLQLVSFGEGTAPNNLQDLLNYSQEKEIVGAIITLADRNQVLDAIDRNFLAVGKNVGIAFTLPLKSTTSDTLTVFKNVEKRSKH